MFVYFVGYFRTHGIYTSGFSFDFYPLPQLPALNGSIHCFCSLVKKRKDRYVGLLAEGSLNIGSLTYSVHSTVKGESRL